MKTKGNLLFYILLLFSAVILSDSVPQKGDYSPLSEEELPSSTASDYIYPSGLFTRTRAICNNLSALKNLAGYTLYINYTFQNHAKLTPVSPVYWNKQHLFCVYRE